MQIPCSWIKELVDISWSAEELAERLTLCGAEAEVQELYAGQFDDILVGRVAELESMEGTDHLKRAVVDSGDGKVQVVCGAPNIKEGQKVLLARTGSTLKDGLEIKKVKLRGVESSGMVCSEAELGLSDDHSGIMVLEDNAEVGMPAEKHLGLDDKVLKLDLTPNRPDLLSAIGVAREVACLAGKKVNRPDFALNESAVEASDYVKVSSDDPDACPRYAARIVMGIKIQPSPWWIKRKLLLCGLRPISNVVDITNLVMLEYGHPLHAFDYDRLGRKEILVRRAGEGERFITLDGKEHSLTPDVLLITDGETAVAAAGVMGGLASEVSPETKDILLESAYFDPVTIRKSRLRLGITSESSTRFEKGADSSIVPEAINRAAYLIQKYAGGEILSGIVDCYPKKITPVEIELRPERVNSLLGTNIPRERMIDILRRLEFEVEDKGVLKIKVPTFQPDVTREVDLIEEIARIDGYDAIPFVNRNLGPLFTPLQKDDLLRSDIRKILTAQGFDETYSSGLAEARLISKLTTGEQQLKILNPIAEDLSVMQSNLVYSLLKSVSHNIAHRNVNLRLFEIGKTFCPGNPPEENEQVGIAISGNSDKSWYAKSRACSFYDLKGAIDSLLETCNVSSADFVSDNQPPYLEDLSFCLKLNGEAVGHAGQISSETALLFDIKQTMFAAVLSFEALLMHQLPEESFKALPRFPAAPRDMAIVVDDSIHVGEILAEIRKVGGDLLEKVEIFDLYRGKQISKGKKSLAFSMIYRSNERSLKSNEVIELQDRIAYHLKEYFKAEIREG